MYAKVNNGQVVQFPYTAKELSADNPNVAFGSDLSDEILAEFSTVRVVVTGAPQFNPVTQVAVQQWCEYNADRSRWETSWTVRDKTQKELDAETEAQAKAVRSERNQKLSASDWTQLPDAPIDSAVWATYRQALRDISGQTGFPWQVTWPQEP